MVGIRKSCREYIYIYIYIQTHLLLLFLINNTQHFKINSDIHNINTRNNLDLHYPLSHLSVYQKSAHYTGIKVFSRLPVPIKQLCHYLKQFKMVLIHWTNILNTI
jgi:hypothetical protein